MDTKNPENYQVEDFVMDESFVNYHFCLNTTDQLFWKSWVLKHPDKADKVEEAKTMLNMLSLRLQRTEYKEELKNIRNAIHIEGVSVKKSRTSLFRPLNWHKPHVFKKIKVRKATALLATLLLVLLAGVYFFSTRPGENGNSLIIKNNSGNKELAFTLEEGTVVTLASNSSLQYPAKFTEKERKVYLKGEARFQVTKDSEHPFKVYQDNIIATVIGTDFNVKKEPVDSVISIELKSGKLVVEASFPSGSLPQSVILEPNQRAVYDFHKQSLIKEVWKQNNDREIVNNHLAFKQSTFEEIAVKIKNVFGVTVVNQSNKINWRFTGEFSNTTAREVMENICFIKKLKLEIREDTFLISNAAGIK